MNNQWTPFVGAMQNFVKCHKLSSFVAVNILNTTNAPPQKGVGLPQRFVSWRLIKLTWLMFQWVILVIDISDSQWEWNFQQLEA